MPLPPWFDRRRRLLLAVVLGLLLAIIAFQSYLLYQQGVVNRSIQVQSAKLLTTFLQSDTAEAGGPSSVAVRLQNVRFKWSDKVYIDTGDMAVRAVPVDANVVNFDDLGSFVFSVQQSTVLISPQVLEGMMNESVFNFPESRVRELKVKIQMEEGRWMVFLKGRINVGVWIPFSMLADLGVDTKTNTLVLVVGRIKALGFLPATRFVRWTPFHLDRLIAMPPNQTLTVDGNRIMIKPLGLFPPPRITGRMSKVVLGEDGIRLSFSGRTVEAPKSAAKNYLYLRGGTSQFGHIRMYDTDVLIQDQDPSDPFIFSLLHYSDMIPKSVVEVHDTQSARVTMPDF